MKVFNKLALDRSSLPELLLEKTVPKISEKIPGLHLQWSASYTLMDSKFVKTALHH